MPLPAKAHVAHHTFHTSFSADGNRGRTANKPGIPHRNALRTLQRSDLRSLCTSEPEYTCTQSTRHRSAADNAPRAESVALGWLSNRLIPRDICGTPDPRWVLVVATGQELSGQCKTLLRIHTPPPCREQPQKGLYHAQKSIHHKLTDPSARCTYHGGRVHRKPAHRCSRHLLGTVCIVPLHHLDCASPAGKESTQHCQCLRRSLRGTVCRCRRPYEWN
mmetsp:Transcript_95703/g.219333  ORF Transcript_95703/g.219333 Transcript_95703/m.219333 type:complete len:219 (+) Transcript_95703:1163-1819(+)